MGSSDSSSSFSNSSSNSSGYSSSSVIEILNYLFTSKYGQSWTLTIEDKLRKEMDKNPNLEKQIEKKYGVSFREFSAALGDPELFKQVFLLPKYRPDLIMREINEELQQIKEFEDMGCPLTEAEINETIRRINDRKSKLSEYKFELILTECQASDIKIFYLNPLLIRVMNLVHYIQLYL